MTTTQPRMTLRLDPLTAERLRLWMTAHRVKSKTEAIHRLLNYSLDSAGIAKRPRTVAAK